MNVLMDDQQVAEKLLHHIANKTTDRTDRLWHEPVDHYRSADRFQRELRVLRNASVPFCASASIAKPGDYIARDAAGIPLIAVRGDDGKARVFRNACRHRGMPVAEGSGCARAFACRYHGWTYRLDGGLRHIPHEDGFPGLDKTAHGLREVPSVERHGLLFVCQDGEARLPEAIDAIAGRITDQHREFNRIERPLDCNWKIIVETFLEGYHIKAAHKQTFYPFGYDNTVLIEHFGRNSRVVFPFQRIEAQRNKAPNDRQVIGNVTMVYHLFPNTVLVVLSHHLNLVVVEPIDAGRSIMRFYSLAHDAVSDERARKDVAFVDQTGTAEDREIACAIQRSIDSGANEHFTFGQFEGAISHFHAILAAALEELAS